MAAPDHTTTPPATQESPSLVASEIDQKLAGAMVGHRLAGGRADEVDVELGRRVLTGEITTEEAIDRIKRDMGIAVGVPRHA